MSVFRVESLEERLMLDASSNGLPPSIVVGRTLSSYFAGDVRNGRETITYTVYNEQAEAETGVLLTTSLGAGVSYIDASIQPDWNGQALAWNLGTIPGYGLASVTLTVALDNSNPLQIDTGARAYATLDAGTVIDAAPAATLRAGSLADPSLLASTIDANTTDPFVREQAAKLDYNPQAIFDYLHNDVGYNSYAGSVRGARGTLWSSAGNALDVASLGVALMRASGVPAQYVSGTLSTAQAQSLILSMFSEPLQAYSYLAAGTPTSDPANDPQLLAATKSHYWFQFDAGAGMTNADPLMAGATVGQAFTAPTGTFSEVANALRATTRITVDAESYSQAAALFGLSGLSTSTVIDQTFYDVELVGRPITVGNRVDGLGLGAIISLKTFTYTPYLLIGDSDSDPASGTLYLGTQYQEQFTNFPLGNQILTGLFLQVTTTGVDGTSATSDRTLFDRIGAAARLTGASTNLPAGVGTYPAVTPLDLYTVNVLPSSMSPAMVGRSATELQSLESQREVMAALIQSEGGIPTEVQATEASTLLTNFYIAEGRAIVAGYAALADIAAANWARALSIAAYFDAPRITIASGTLIRTGVDATPSVVLGLDATRDTMRTVVAPGQGTAASATFEIGRGLQDNVVEQTIGTSLNTGSQAGLATVTTLSIFDAARAQGIDLVGLVSANASILDTLAISDEAKARISQALQAGKLVIVPTQSPVINGQARIGWYETDLATGETYGVLEDGTHGENGIPANELIPAEEVESLTTSDVVGEFFGTVAGIGVQTAELVSVYTVIATGQLSAPDLASEFVKKLVEQGLVYLKIYVFPGSFLAGAIRGYERVTDITKILRLPGPADPPIDTEVILTPQLGIEVRTNVDSRDVTASGSVASGAVSGNVQGAGVTVSGTLSGSWNVQGATSQFVASSLQAASGTVVNGQGQAVGSGAIGLLSAASLGISGNVSYSVSGSGALSFYGAAGTSLGVSGEWSSYSATATGSVVITLTTDGLTLNGTALPAGTYTIATSSASLGGSGATSSPNFAGSASVTATGATVALGQGTGSLSIGGAAVDPLTASTFTGFNGTISVAAIGNGTDSVALAGSASEVLRVVVASTPLTADQNTPVTFLAAVATSLADSYTLSAQAPAGWTVTIDAAGNITATPAPGTQEGTFPIRIIARSKTTPNLVAQTIVNVAVSATQSGVALNVHPDVIFTVPYMGSELPTGFRAGIRNLGPAADTFAVTGSNVPSGFTLAQAKSNIVIPAGELGVIGLYLVPDGSAPLPLPGAVLTFDVTATSTTDPSITQTVAVSFTVPAIEAVSLTGAPAAVSTTPGVGVTETVTITNVGNVAETIALAASTPAGLTLSGLSTITLQPGESTTQVVTLTPDALTPLGSLLGATITATFGSSALIPSVYIPVSVVVPGASAIANAATAASQLGRPDLAARLNDLAAAITNLVQDPTNAVAKGQATAALDAVILLLGTDPYLASNIPALQADATALAQATTADEVQAAIAALGTDLDTVSAILLAEAEHPFTFSFLANSQVGRPQVATTYQLILQNTGSQTGTYDLSIAGLPAGVTGTISQSSITLGPGEVSPGSIGVPSLIVTLTSTSATELAPFSFTVTASPQGVPELGQTITGQFTVRQNLVQVTSVSTDPAFTNPGGQVGVSARILNAVNKQQAALVSYTVKDSGGTVIFTSSAVSTTLNVLATLTDVNLGSFSTTGFALGQDTITVTVTDTSGNVLATGTGSILIGTPVTATLTTTPTTVPSGTATVTTTLQVDAQAGTFSPLSLLGQTAIGGASGVAVSGNYAYVGVTGGIDVVDISDPAHPQVLSTIATTDFPNKTVYSIYAQGNELFVVAEQNNLNNVFLTYSLATPASPTLQGQTPVDFPAGSNLSFQIGMSFSNNHVYLSSHWYRYYIFGGTVFEQFGESAVIDVSDPVNPAVVAAIYNNPPDPPNNDGYPDGTSNIWQTATVSAGIQLIGTTTATRGTVDNVQGQVMVVDTTNPASPSVLEKLNISGMAVVTGISVQGNLALVIGSTEYWGTGLNGLRGNVVVAILSLADPTNPQVISTQTLAVDSKGIGYLTYLGNNLYATSGIVGLSGAPQVLILDASDPFNVTASSTSVPNSVNGDASAGGYYFTTDGSSLAIYNLGSASSIPVLAQATIPSGVSVVPGTFSLAPVSTIANPDGSKTLVWDFAVDAATASRTISWQSTVSGIQPGESIVVARDAAVTFSTAPLNTTAVDLAPFINNTVLSVPGGEQVPAGGTTIDVGGVSFTMATYQGAGTGVVATGAGSTASPSAIDLPVSLQDVTTVYTLINSYYGQPGFLDGTVEFFGTNGAHASFDLVQGTNIRDYNNLVFTNTLPEGTPSISFLNGQVRFDRQTFVLPESFLGQTLTDIRLSGFGNNPTGQPILAAVSVAKATIPGDVGTLGLPDQVVAGQQILGIAPATQTIAPGESASFTVTLLNPTDAPVMYTLSVQGVDAGWLSFPTSITVAANDSTDVPLVLSPGAAVLLGDYGFSVSAAGDNGATGSVLADLVLQGTPVLPDAQSHGIVAAISPTQATAGQGTSAKYVVRLTNTGSASESFHLAIDGLPAGVTAAFSQDDLTILPGSSNFRDVTLILTTAAGTTPGAYVFSVSATSNVDASLVGSASASLSVTSVGVSVSLSPPSGNPGDGYQVTVANTGTTTDTFDLALGGLGAAVATLATSQVTLAPGASQVVAITTKAVGFSLPGNLPFTVSATSHADPSVLSAATAALTIAPASGMSAQFSPAVALLSAPGPVAFRLVVQNSGNTEDQYEATILRTNGPITAYLIGLDGRATQTISGFRLVGLSTGTITLLANLAANGQGTVTVQVRSLTNGALVAEATATAVDPVTPTPTPTPAPTATKGPEVTRVVRYGIHMSPTTIVLTFNQPLDAATAQDVGNYRIIAPNGSTLRVVSAVYDPAAYTVILRPRQRIDLHRTYRLIVNGTTVGGVAGASGIHLEGQSNGTPGTNFQTELTWRNLGTTVPPRFRHAPMSRPAHKVSGQGLHSVPARVKLPAHSLGTSATGLAKLASQQ